MSLNDADLKRIANALDRIESAIATFGSAMNLMNRGYSAHDLDDQGNQTIRDAFQHAPELNELLPQLAVKVRDGSSMADDGFEIRPALASVRKRLGL